MKKTKYILILIFIFATLFFVVNISNAQTNPNRPARITTMIEANKAQRGKPSKNFHKAGYKVHYDKKKMIKTKTTIIKSVHVKKKKVK